MKREPLFEPYVVDLSTGERRRMTRDELREAHRLWHRYRWLRTRPAAVAEALSAAVDTEDAEAELDEAFQTALALDDARDDRRGAVA